MNLELHNEIVTYIRNYRGFTKDLQNKLIEKYPNVVKGALYSIVSNEYQRIAIRCNHKSNGVTDELFSLYMGQREAQEDALIEFGNFKLDRKKILNIAVAQNIPPTLIARVILAKFCENEENDRVVKPTKKNISDMLSYSYLIEDSDLSCEVYWATLYDEHYSPVADFIKQHLGYEYECKLRYCCLQEKMAFKDENALRKEGYDKTPDIKLELPVLVNGVAITWIESKALFADIDIHENYTREQYLSYWNRWGPGMIIYWFGYTEDVISPSEKRFIIMDSFPKSDMITHLKYSQSDDNLVDTMTNKVENKLNIDKQANTSAVQQ